MEEKRSYSVDPELIHYGVKGMTWKNHKYRSNTNGEYVYNNVGQIYRHVTGQDTFKDQLGRGYRYVTGQENAGDKINNAYDEARNRLNNVDADEIRRNVKSSLNSAKKTIKNRPKVDGLSGATMKRPATQSPTTKMVNKTMSTTSKILSEQKKQREAYLKSGAQRRKTNSGYGETSNWARDSKNFYDLGKDKDKYSAYEIVGNEDSFGNRNVERTFVKDRTKKKRLVSKTTDLGTDKFTGISGGKITTHYKRVEPGRYNSYSDAAKGEAKRAVKAVRKSAKDAYRIGSNLKTKVAKEIKGTTPTYARGIKPMADSDLMRKANYYKKSDNKRARKSTRR